MRLLLRTIFLFFTVIASGQNDSILVQLQQFGLEDGLSHQLINSICQDDQGLMWFGTNYGLNRYDGIHFKQYFPKNSQLKGFEIKRLLKDANGKIWIFYGKNSSVNLIYHIDIFDPLTEKVESIKDYINIPFEAPYEDINFRCFGGETFVAINRQTNAAWQFDGKQFIKFHRFPFNIIYSNRIDAEHYWIWGNRDFDRYTYYPKNFVYIINNQHQVLDSMPIDGKIMYSKNSNGKIWAYPTADTDFGLIEIDTREKKQITSAEFFAPTDDFFWNRIGDTLVILNQNLRIKLPNATPQPICIFKDKQGNFWFSTGKLLYFVSYSKNKFYPVNKNLPLDISKYRSVLNLSDSNLLSIASSKCYFTNAKNQGLSFYDHFGLEDDGRYSLSLFKDSKENIWEGVEGSIIFQYKLASKETKRFDTPDRKDDFGMVWTFFEDKQKDIWLGTAKGIAKVDRAKNFLTPFVKLNEFKELAESVVLHFYQNKAGIWVVSSSGLYLWDLERGIIDRFYEDGDEAHYLPYNNLSHLQEDAAGDFWITTKGGGLIKWNPETKKQQQFTTQDGLSHNVLYAVYADDYEYLWMSSDYGINRFDKATETNQIFTPKDGILSKEFNTISHLQTKNGRIFFGGQAGLIVFDPKDFITQSARTTTNLVLTKFQKWNQLSDQYTDFTTSVIESNRITLSPQDKAFVLEVAYLDYVNPSTHQYQYKIDGHYEDWQNMDGPVLRLNNLPYGNYQLKIRAKKLAGAWSDPLIFSLVIQIPFYLTWWGVALEILLLGGLVYMLIQWRTRTLKVRQQELEEEVANRTQELEESKLLLEIQAEDLQELDRLKSRFFSNISHELRTPLTLILGPLATILDHPDELYKPAVFNKLKMIQRNGKSLLNLVEEILDLSKLEASKLELKETAVVLDKFLQQLMQIFEAQAKIQGIIFKLENSLSKETTLMLDPKKLEKIINNLISNALKFTTKGGQISLKTYIKTDFIYIAVQDSGKGISAEHQLHIFDRFYQVPDEAQPMGGTGLGLAFSKELVNLMGGEISVRSELGKGSTFEFYIPFKISAAIDEPLLPLPDDLVEEYYEEEAYIDDRPVLSNTTTILLVEDNPDMRRFVSEMLSPIYSIITAENGAVALECLKENPSIQLVISDVMMPVMDGFTLLDRIKKEDTWRGLPIIMLTARAAKEDKLKALRIGVDDYLLKPFLNEELLARVKNVVFNYQQRELWKKNQLLNYADSDFELVDLRKKEEPIPKVIEITEADLEWIKTIDEFILKHISDEQLDVALLVGSFYLSRRQLTRKITKITGLSPAKYILEHRLELGREYLETSRFRSVKETAFASGFNDVNIFSKWFIQRFGKKPSDYL